MHDKPMLQPVSTTTVLHLNYTDTHSGAATAALRIHDSLLQKQGESILSYVKFSHQTRNDYPNIIQNTNLENFCALASCYIDRAITKLEQSVNPILHSSGLLSSIYLSKLKKLNPDLFHLHWVQGGSLSLSSISSIRQPIVWSLHDSWPFLGCEHHPLSPTDPSITQGYSQKRSTMFPININLNSIISNKKLKLYRAKNNMVFVAPSKFMYKLARESYLLRGMKIIYIPHPIDTNRFQPVNKALARKILGLPQEKFLIGSYGVGSTASFNKGSDFAFDILNKLASLDIPFSFVTTAAGSLKCSYIFNLPYLHDVYSQVLFYSAIDVFLITSRIESFSLSAQESLACGTPVVGFNTGALQDFAEYTRHVRLTNDTASSQIVENILHYFRLSTSSNFSEHRRCLLPAKFSYSEVSSQYKSIYQSFNP